MVSMAHKRTEVERKVVMERVKITERHSRRPVLVLEVPFHVENALIEIAQLLESRGAQVYVKGKLIRRGRSIEPGATYQCG